MTLLLILFGIFYIRFIDCIETDSFEVNGIEVAPYETIIFRDIANIINEFENNVNLPTDGFANESDSDENIEDLLLEYQRYLEKAQRQRKSYMEKVKTNKNKVPPFKREKYTKMKSGAGIKLDKYYGSNYINPVKDFETNYNTAMDYFMPMNNKLSYINRPDITTNVPKVKESFASKIMSDEKRFFDLQQRLRNPVFEPINSSCFCKNNQVSCECSCKTCLIPLQEITSTQNDKKIFTDRETTPFSSQLLRNSSKNTEYLNNRSLKTDSNMLNIRIKLDIQLPKILDNIQEHCNNHSCDKTDEHDDGISKESTSAVNVPFRYFNFPIPIELIGYERNSKTIRHDSMPLNKISFHRKKKSKYNPNNKKHRKKSITFHSIKLTPPHPTHTTFEEKYNLNDFYVDKKNNTADSSISNVTQELETIINVKLLNKTGEPMLSNETTAEKKGYPMENTVNISNVGNNSTEHYKIANSIETELTTISTNNTAITEKNVNLRRKRNALEKNYTVSNYNTANNENVKVINMSQTLPQLRFLKVMDVNVSKQNNMHKNVSDSDLLFWASSLKSPSIINSKNITSLILEREHKKAKLNMSRETIKLNHTKALEKAVFGDVDWDDVDTVAPVFMSFVGKYITGVLTFCSDTLCHSMKCAEKTCVHRTCKPSERVHRKGHCNGSNHADSVASMESIMDLPSNIVFEVVDILQDRMLGKMYGKVTLCISSKCITFEASKKTFLKSKCSMKDLSTTDHCPNIKKILSE